MTQRTLAVLASLGLSGCGRECDCIQLFAGALSRHQEAIVDQMAGEKINDLKLARDKEVALGRFAQVDNSVYAVMMAIGMSGQWARRFAEVLTTDQKHMLVHIISEQVESRLAAVAELATENITRLRREMDMDDESRSILDALFALMERAPERPARRNGGSGAKKNNSSDTAAVDRLFDFASRDDFRGRPFGR